MTSDETIAQLQAELAALRQEQQTFTATVTHDLRAPLRHISAYAQLLQEEAAPVLNDEARGFIGTIVQAAATLSAQLDALSAYARLATVELHPERVELGALVAAVVRDLEAGAAAQADPLAVRWDIAPGLPAVWADAPLLGQALMHVLGNAVVFSQARTPPEIAVSATAEDATGAVVLCVRDNGMGCDLNHSDRLFTVFARMHSPRQLQGLRAVTRSPAGFVAGLGMGLASTRRIVQRLGGRVTMASAPDAGCSVTLHLPPARPSTL